MLNGSAGDEVLIGGPGVDALDEGPGNNNKPDSPMSDGGPDGGQPSGLVVFDAYCTTICPIIHGWGAQA